jgi:hypothetical protein
LKWLLFGFCVFIGIPLMTALASWSRNGRVMLVAALVASTVLKISVNFASMEGYRGPDRGFEVSLTDLIAISLGAGLLMTQWRQVRWLPMNLFLFGAYIVVAILSATDAPDQMLASFSIFKWTKTLILYWAIFNCVYCDWPIEGIVAGIIAAAGIETLFALQQKYLFGMYRIHGTFDHSNTLPAYFVVVVPILLSWLMARKRPTLHRVVAMTAVFAMCFVVLATMSRAGLAILAMTILAVLIFAILKAPSRSNFGLVSIFMVAFLAGGAKAADSFIERFETAPESSGEARDEFNIAADLMAHDNLWGVGVNCFSKVLTNDHRYRESIAVMENEEHAGVCHHIYRLTAAEMGYIGLVLFLLILGRFLWTMGIWTFGAASQEQFILFGVFVGCIGLHVVGLLEWVFRVTPVWNLFWIASGLGAATALRLAHGRQTIPAI